MRARLASSLWRFPFCLLLITCTSDQALSPRRSLLQTNSEDSTPPTVALSAPLEGAVITAPATVVADASDDVLLAGVEFFLGGVSLGPEDDTAPYEALLNTDTMPAGPGVLTAQARDTAGNTALSVPVNVLIFHPDTTPPTVSITAPVEGSVLTAPTAVTADAGDDFLLAGVTFRANDVDLGAEDDTAPFESLLNTDTLPDGPYTLVAVARDTAGNNAVSAVVNITVFHPDVSPPTVAITAPADGAAIGVPTLVTADATDDGPVAGVLFKLNGVNLAPEDVTAPYEALLRPDTLPPGLADLTAVARDTAGNSSVSAVVQVTIVPPDVTPPTVAITAPPDGAVLSAPATITANASDDGLVAGVLFKLNGVDLENEDLSAPYEATLNTDTLPDGSYALTALARDTAGNTALSAIVSVTVSHPDVTPPTVAITSPLPGATVAGVISVTADASDDKAVAGVQFQVGGVNAGVEDVAAPYAVSLDTYTLPNGLITLTALARDGAGNTALSVPVQVTVNNPPPKSIVVIMTDDMRYDHLQYMPLTMAQLGSEAVVFSNAVASTPLCCPSRSSILTGRYAHNHGVLTNNPPNGGATRFNASSTVATWLHGAAYRTGMFGKYLNNYNLISPVIPPGWDDFQVILDPHYYNYDLNENGVVRRYGSAPGDYSTTVFGDKAVSFINTTPAHQSLLLFYTPIAPHAPAMPFPSDAGRFATFPNWRPPSYNEAVVSDKTTMVKSTPRFTSAQINASDALHRQMLESLQAADRGVEAIILALKAQGRWSNTLLFFLSDNGLSWGENRMLDRKMCPYEACIRIPFVVRAPGVGPRTETKWASNVDLAPTIAAFAGVTAPANVNGRDLLPLLANPGAAWRTEVLIEQLGNTQNSANFYSVRNNRFLYTEYLNGEKELYDLKTDPYQLTNVVNNSSYAATKTALAAKLQVLKTTP